MPDKDCNAVALIREIAVSCSARKDSDKMYIGDNSVCNEKLYTVAGESELNPAQLL
jgi:hypothetical protein